MDLRGSIVFIVEDTAAVSDALKEILHRENFQVIIMETTRLAKSYLEMHDPPDVILLDLDLPDSAPDQTMSLIQEWAPRAPVIVIAGTVSKDQVEECSRLGAFAVYEKVELTPPAMFVSVVRCAITGFRLRRKSNEVRSATDHMHNLVVALCAKAQAGSVG